MKKSYPYISEKNYFLKQNENIKLIDLKIDILIKENLLKLKLKNSI